VAPVSPAAETVIVAVPVELGVKLELATPPEALTGEAGLNEPETPVAAKVIALLAVVTVFPLTSWIVAVYATGMPVWVLPVAGTSASLAGVPRVSGTKTISRK
jgi:hypothetical protein